MLNWNSLKKTGLVSIVCLSGVLASSKAFGAEMKNSSTRGRQGKSQQINFQKPASKTPPSEQEVQATISLGQKIQRMNTLIRSSKLKETTKQALLTAFDSFIKTPRGFEIITNAPSSFRLCSHY